MTEKKTNAKKQPSTRRINPKYPPWYQFTVARCDKCGELYEPALEHICRKKNSYPFNGKF